MLLLPDPGDEVARGLAGGGRHRPEMGHQYI